MNVLTHEELRAVVVAPLAEDDPTQLLDRIDNELTRTKSTTVVLDLSGVDAPGPWLKVVGPQIPDADLRIVLSEKGFAMARMLNLTALFDWFPSVDVALRQGV